MTDAPILLWFRRDLRLRDHPALHEAASSGRPVIPVFLLDEGSEGIGAAPRMRLGMGVAALRRSLEGIGSRLILRRGRAAEALAALRDETGGEVWFTRLHDPDSRRRDEGLGRAFPGHLLFEPEEVATQGGGHFKVNAPFLKALLARHVGEALPAPTSLRPPVRWPDADQLEDWRLDGPMDRGAAVVAPWQAPGEDAARARLDRFVRERLGTYADARNYPAQDGSSRLSENLTTGEISARECWRAGLAGTGDGAATFLRELSWRDFSHHLLWHEPHLATDHWKPAWAAFPWQREETPEVEAWKRGMTGIRLVDAGMREMWVTGRMHNRARMVTASLLTKHMMTDWRVGQAFFADCLTDWDPAANAVNWQWVAGSGPDATPFFRVFSPTAQAKAWDGQGEYERAWIAEGQADPPATALSFFEAVPRSWGLSAAAPYPRPVIDLAAGRAAALAAFGARDRPQ